MVTARTDDDSWDITESVGATALGVAMARAAESDCDCPLFTDRYAQLFVDAAVIETLNLMQRYDRPPDIDLKYLHRAASSPRPLALDTSLRLTGYSER